MNLLEYLAFGWKYHHILWKKTPGFSGKVTTLNYVVHENTKDWILGAKARRLSRYSNKKSEVFYSATFDDLNTVDAYFFLHPNLFIRALRKNAWLLEKKCIVMFTHPEFKNRFSALHRRFVLNKAHKVIFLNKEHARLMLDSGLDKSKVEIMHLASDGDMFQPHDRANGKVCMSMAYYPRKNPDLLLEVVQGMPHRNFLLIGKGWEAYPAWSTLSSLPNFEYVASPEYEEYPALYAACDVFLSTSKLEGGPVPLLETMLSNLVPVASETGYCTDIIRHGKNGFLFPVDADASSVIPLIDKAYGITANVRESVQDFTWQKYSNKIDELFDN